MDQLNSESDVSMSPTQILERLQVLRQLQLLQRGKLQKQRLQYQETSETSSNITEIVSHFSNSTSYNTFRSLLQSPHDALDNDSPRINESDVSHKVKEKDLIDGISVLNLSQESEFIANSSISSRSRSSAPSRNEECGIEQVVQHNTNLPTTRDSIVQDSVVKTSIQKHISLDEMPILTPKKDFEALIIEKLKNDKPTPKERSPQRTTVLQQQKKPFLRRGEGMARFGLKKNDLVIQNTKALPWRNRNMENKSVQSTVCVKQLQAFNNNNEKMSVCKRVAAEPKHIVTINRNIEPKMKIPDVRKNCQFITEDNNSKETNNEIIENSNCELHADKYIQKSIKISKGKHPLMVNKGKTWAAVLTNEQNDLLKQLKQSDYYKNFGSPTKSTISDVSCDDNLSKLRQEREVAEQNMFELLENKVSHESFNLENSFFNKFLRRSKLECSGESTPLILQKCLVKNPDLMHIAPDLNNGKRNEISQSDVETCQSDYTECCSDTCSSISSCCSCKTVEPAKYTAQNCCIVKNNKKESEQQINNKSTKKVNEIALECKKSENDNVTENDIMKANMAEMNAKLITTSELLKDRLCELEDEIETFRKENAHLSKLREEIDLERQKFYEEKSASEQKFNEEKVLSEYYLAEERDKLTKQKQMYERHVREMRGRLNKKERDEVVNLKKEIEQLKEEIRMKDAKSTSTIARLRNQMKIMEKEKKDLLDEVEKVKKENRRIQHSNNITRRITNIKYLAEINKKLTDMTSKETKSEIDVDSDVKYKSYEIERQSRSRNIQIGNKSHVRPRAKSVPNLKVTSRYAKYFSQRDSVSQLEQNSNLNIERTGSYTFDNEQLEDYNEIDNKNESTLDQTISDNEEDNHLEKLYIQTFRSTSPKSNRSSINSNSDCNILERNNHNSNEYFLRKSNSATSSAKKSISPTIISTSPYLQNSSRSLNRSKSPIAIRSHRSSNHRSPIYSHNSADTLNPSGNLSNSYTRPKSPASIHSKYSLHSQQSATVMPNDEYRDKLMAVSPEPSTSKTSLTKTNLNPMEIKKSDGSKELRFPNGNIKHISADGKYSKFIYYNGDVKENFYNEGRIKYFYAENKTFHTNHADGLEVLEFPDGQVEKRYKDGSSEIRLPNGSVRYFDPKNEHVREEWRFPDGAALTVSANGEQRIVFSNGQVEVHAADHKRREFPDGTVKLVYNDGTSETRYASGRVRIKDKHGNLLMDSASG